MVTHVVIFTWIVDASAEQVARLREALDKLAAEMVATAKITHGPDLHFRDGNGDYALVATFADRAGWNAYQADSRHQAFLRDFVSPLLASRLTAQF